MSDITLEQQKIIIDRLGTIEDQQTVLTGIAMRLDGSVDGLATELRGMLRMLQRLEHRVRDIEGTSDKGGLRPLSTKAYKQLKEQDIDGD